MQTHTTGLTSFARPAAGGLAALALGISTVAGIGAPAAHAEGSGAAVRTASQATGQGSGNRDAWLEKHGTAPLGYTSGRATGPLLSPVAQHGLGSTAFDLRMPSQESHEPVPAPDGTYQVDVGDGSTGEQNYVDVRDGVADLGDNQTLKTAAGSEMVQFKGPVLEGATGGNPDEPQFVGSDGNPSTLPQFHAGSVYSAEKTLATIRTQDSMNNTGPHGVYTENEGFDAITFNPESTYALPDGDQPKVKVTYQNAETKKPVTIPTNATFGKSEQGELQLKGGVLPELPSGRYTFTFTDREGTDMSFSMMVGDPNRAPETGDSPMYALPY